MKRIIRDSVTGATNKPKNAVWVKDGQDMRWKIFKGTNNDTVDPDFLSLANKRNHANYIDVIVVPNGTHPNEVINSSSQNEYEYRKNIYLKRKHEFETLGEDDNNDVLSREEKMNIAKAEMDKVNPKSVKSAKDATFKNDKRLSTTSERYKGYLIVLDRGGYGYNVYDKNRELEDAGYPSREAAKKFIDELVSEADDEIESSVDMDEETEDPKWICLDIKHVRDSDGMLTDYALYTTEDEDKYICMFGDVDAYPPDEMYADAEFDSEEEALEWFEDYTGPGDEDEDEDYDIYHDDIDSAEELDEDEDGLDHPDQEFDSADTSINSTKLPAIYKMISIPEGSVGIDFGGGKWDNAIEHIRDLGATLCVYDPYNRSKAYNKETLKTLRANGGADWAVTSNVLNVIKEPSARKAVLENISKITKPGAPIYITVYEGRGDGKAGQTKSGYQMNRKTKDYIEEIQEVFPDAKRKGKLIVATNKRSADSSVDIKSSSEIIWDDLDWNQQIQVMKRYIRNYKGVRIFEDFADYINKPVEDIIDAFSDAESRGDIRIPERMQLDSEYRNDDIYSSTEGYVYTYCDECGKKNRVKVTFNNFNEPFNDTEYKCKYCGTNNLLTDPHSYDENGNVVEASQSYLDRIEELMEQGLDEETASREAYAEFYPDEYDADDYDEIYSANYGGRYYVDDKYIDSSTDITAASKLWMGKYKSAKDNKMHKVYFEFDTSDFEEAEQEFEGIISEPYSYARLLGTAPHEALLQKDGFEKIQSSSTVVTAASSGKLDKYMNVTKDRKKYAVHYTEVNTDQDAWTIYSDFRAQVSKISPYDDADYAWADIRNGHIDVIRNGKVVKRSYYFNADDMDVENTEWCDIIIDEAIDLIAKINKDIEPRMVYNATSIASKNKSSITSSADKKIRPIDELDDVTDQLRDDLIQKLMDVMSGPNFGFTRTDVLDYSRVDIRFDDDENRIEVEVGAEVDYDGLMQIAQDLDPIIQSYDKAAYFDAEDAGLLIAFIPYESLRNHMKVNSASDLPEPSLDPPEYDDPEEVDEDVTVEFDMDRIRIDVDKSGSWEYIDDSFLNDVLTDDDTLYSEEYDVKVRDRNGLLEDLDDILKYDIPVEAGEYRISCHITLVYHITGIEKYDKYPDDNYGDSSEYSTENVEVKFDFHDSYVEDFRIVD